MNQQAPRNARTTPINCRCCCFSIVTPPSASRRQCGRLHKPEMLRHRRSTATASRTGPPQTSVHLPPRCAPTVLRAGRPVGTRIETTNAASANDRQPEHCPCDCPDAVGACGLMPSLRAIVRSGVPPVLPPRSGRDLDDDESARPTRQSATLSGHVPRSFGTCNALGAQLQCGG